MRLDLTGQVFGRLTAIRFSHWKSGNGSYWICKCDCGTEKPVPMSSLKKGSSKSCGCLDLELKRSRSKDKHPLWKGVGDISGRYFKQTRKGAKSRGLEFEISLLDMWNKFLEQDKKCALTGLPISFPTEKDKNDSERTASIDRIDSHKGYTKDNIQWVHKDINKMKQDFDEDKLVELCLLVISNSKNRAIIHHEERDN